MARISYLRPATTPSRTSPTAGSRLTAWRPRAQGPGPQLPVVVLGVAALILVGVVLLLVLSGPSLSSDSDALARVGMPLSGGTVDKVTVTTGPHSRPIPATMRGDQVWPQGTIPAHQMVTVEVVVRRPGWISWLAGSHDRLELKLMTPSASLRSHYLTLRPGQPIVLQFKDPVRVLAVGPSTHLARRILARPMTEVRLHRSAEAGSLNVAAAPRTWESASPTVVSWFPTGSATSAVASPLPGTRIGPRTPLTLTFSGTVQQALGGHLPPVSPATAGSWHTVNEHTITFRPEGLGYGLGANVTVALPGGVKLVGAQQSAGASSARWQVPAGSPLRLQELLAGLGYLPMRFHGSSGAVAHTLVAQEAAAIHPPQGQFTWRYPHVPAALHGFWAPGRSGVMTRGALMAFQNDHNLNPDGSAGPAVWNALFRAVINGNRSHFGYSFVSVSLNGQSLNLWHNGRTVLTTPVNTGISSRPTDPGTYPVYEHLRETTMSGTNPDGSQYNDPGIQYVSYFNGGDALHAFTRAQYGSPQSLGCVEMPLGPAGQVWPYTPIGTLVHVA